MPRIPASGRDLEGPEFLEGPNDGSTAPLSEFVAAGAVLLGIVMFIAGAALASPAVILAGVLIMFVVTGGFALIGRKAPMRRMLTGARDWLPGRWPTPTDDDRGRR
ncbi:MAG TPA: hypothetical protein VG845_06890 [Dehalococcoidia bacterium]|nr:hypothetical protein [Dehalococcoidia bacterium]